MIDLMKYKTKSIKPILSTGYTVDKLASQLQSELNWFSYL